MAYRFTNTDKWNDSWFSSLPPAEKLLFNYLCDNCDIAGFIEMNVKRWAVDIGYSVDEIEGARQGLGRGLTYSQSEDCIYINNFLKHQKNLPLNESNQAHKGIIKRFDIYSDKFGFSDYNEFLTKIQNSNKFNPSRAPAKGLGRGLGNGNGKGNGNGIEVKGVQGEKKQDFITEIIKRFQEAYFSRFGIEYVINHAEKEKQSVSNLFIALKKANQELNTMNTIQTLEFFSWYFNQVMGVSIPWVQENMSIPIVLLKFNDINRTLKHGNKASGKAGTTDEELIGVFLKHFGT